MIKSKIFTTLLDATGIDADEFVNKQGVLDRDGLIDAVRGATNNKNTFPDKKFDKLPKDVQEWVIEASEAKLAGEALPPLPDEEKSKPKAKAKVSAVEDDEADEADGDDAAGANDEDDEMATNKSAAKGGAAKKAPAKKAPATAKASKAPAKKVARSEVDDDDEKPAKKKSNGNGVSKVEKGSSTAIGTKKAGIRAKVQALMAKRPNMSKKAVIEYFDKKGEQLSKITVGAEYGNCATTYRALIVEGHLPKDFMS